ncbi:unnamed protein product [Hydatigera taeniaeformis]|uniref:Fibronectin type-III domain-containing protein n=1 Tax=Hydatigena taeniaeformis TaxID=6205 RepID=A0A0R3XCZ7_HYDTA|nr:unnamed protein product [Hydatigera taeniaeformis]
MGPLNLRLTHVEGQSYKLQWKTDPPNSKGVNTLLLVLKESSGSGAQIREIADFSSGEFTVRNLRPQTQYTLLVTGLADDVQHWSVSGKFTTLPDGKLVHFISK